MNDLIMTITSIMFSISLIPEIIKSFKNHKVDIDLRTLLITTIGLALNLYVLIDLKMVFSAVTTSITVSCWLWLTVGKIMFRNV